jgi:drug/metabolite transporter (DMT)-like permease
VKSVVLIGLQEGCARAQPEPNDAGFEWKAWGFTAVGVMCFSGTFASTRLALSAFDPFVVALVRGAGAGAAAVFYLLISRSSVPSKPQFLRLGGAALGIVIGFPCLFSFALLMVPATHASVVGAILPLLTAFFGVVIGRERASRGFWISAVIGTLLTTLFCLYRSGLSAIQGADILLLLAFVACSYGYAEGGILSKELGGWQVICWALALAFPIELVAFLGYAWTHGLWIRPPSVEACAGLFYVTAISQYIGFYFYYKGLALGGVAKMSQMQLFLPFCAIAVSHFVLGEVIDAATIVGAILITGTVLAWKFHEAKRSRNFQASEALERAQRHFHHRGAADTKGNRSFHSISASPKGLPRGAKEEAD